MGISPIIAAERRRAAFTLIEVLAALLLMAIVIPVIIHGLGIASQAGEVAQRKALAARIGDRVLNEAILSGQWNQAGQRGTEMQGPYQFKWTIRNQIWKPPLIAQDAITEAAMREISVDVNYTAQGKDCVVQISTLINTQVQ